MSVSLDDLPGFRRRIVITPGPNLVCAELEDDFHRMGVTLVHDGRVVTSVAPIMDRAPWTTCPGAVAKLKETFTGVALDALIERGEKTQNCTHLYDLALWAGAHAGDSAPLVYDVVAADPLEDGRRISELRRDGVTVLTLTHVDHRIVEPAAFAGRSLFDLRPWIESLPRDLQEAARILRWGTMIANGRTLPLENQSDASRMPSNCFTFQPAMAARARRVGKILDFSTGGPPPLNTPVSPEGSEERAKSP